MPVDLDYFLRSSSKVLKADEIQRIFRVFSGSKSPTDPQLFSYTKFYDNIHPFGKGFYIRYA